MAKRMAGGAAADVRFAARMLRRHPGGRSPARIAPPEGLSVLRWNEEDGARRPRRAPSAAPRGG